MFKHEKPGENLEPVVSDQAWYMTQLVLELRNSGRISKQAASKCGLAIDRAIVNANNVTVQTRLKVGKAVAGSVN